MTRVSPLTRIDALLGRVTMYRLVVIALSTLAIITMIFGATGRLAHRPAAMLAGLAVLLAVSYAGNRLFAALFRVTPHSESSIITALLLFFILQPTTEPHVLLQVALAALFASASKYILAVRGRHIFNPAAVGALWLAIFHFYLALWWVASPALLPIVAVLALLVLHRTRRIRLATVFIVVAGTILLVRSLSGGGSVGDALTFAFAQTPLVFLAGFMLSEPLTLPPARWQQLTVAAVVGALFAIPITIGSFLFGPESALIVGNALAFAFGQRRGIALVVTAKRALSPVTVEFEFKPDRPVRFAAGQYLELSLPHRSMDSRGARRVFSISSAPADTDALTIAITVPAERGSSFKKALCALKAGDRVAATGVSGDFRLPANSADPLLLVAGGIGITPFASHLAALDDGHGRDIVVIYAVSNPEQLPYADVLHRSGVRTVVVSGRAGSTLNGERTGDTGGPVGAGSNSTAMIGEGRFEHLTTGLTAQTLAAAVPDIDRRHVLVSGPPGLVDRVGQAARSLNARSLTKDHFTGY